MFAGILAGLVILHDDKGLEKGISDPMQLGERTLFVIVDTDGHLWLEILDLNTHQFQKWRIT